MNTLLQDIEAFLTKHSMAETTFGFLALGDKPYVQQARNGRRSWPETEKKVRDFMAAYEPPERKKAASKKASVAA
jgi:hypothetical protein